VTTDRPALLDVAVAAAGLAICTNGPVLFFTRRVLDRSGYWEDGIVRAFLVSVGVMGAVMLADTARRWRRDGRALRTLAPWPVAAIGLLSAWALLSTWWSVAPGITAQRALIYVGLALFAWWLALLTFERQVVAVAVAMGATSAASGLVLWLRRPVGVMDLTGDWQGIFTNRNSLAATSALGLLAIIGVAARWRRRPLVVAASLAVGVLQLVLLRGSGSDTSKWALIGALVLTAALIPAVNVARRRVHPLVAAGVVVALTTVVVVGVIQSLDRLGPRLGSDSLLTSRRPIWAWTRDAIAVHPVRGYGFFAYWDTPAALETSIQQLGRAYGSAHNSWLEMMLGLGVVGLALYIVVVLAALTGHARAVWERSTVARWWWVAALLLLLLENQTESFVLWFSYNYVLVLAAAIVPWLGRATRSVTDARAAVASADPPAGAPAPPPAAPAP
jgi:O-antigen ligase